MLNLLRELLKDSSKSDRKLARILGVSQPTVSRTRNKLVTDGFIEHFTVIPDLPKMGFEILAVNCFRSRVNKELKEKAREITMANPNIVFSARCQGEGKNGIVISLHKSYTDYSRFITNIIAEGGDDIEEHETFLISLNDYVAKPLSLKYLAEVGKE
ncbi:MAG: Lrp/AsnC family transcriptional regulator [Candidatus Bathyarchaeota archaeon]|nr:MAG: Lrp/AsnC family transcriptional regulator [Candidatus Bathyarchaeota archaeon]